MLTLLIFVSDIANIWLARIELETGLEAAALAGVESWGQGSMFGDTSNARNVAVQFAAANTVVGTSLVITTNYSAMGDANQNASLTGNLVFARVTSSTSPYTLDPALTGTCAMGSFGGAVTAQSTATVNSLSTSLFGVPLGPYTVQAKATARYNCNTGASELIRVAP